MLRHWVVVLALLGHAACARAPASPQPLSAARPAARPAHASPIRPPRLFVLADDPAATFVATDPDGSRRLIAHGLRFVERADGAILRAAQLLPPTVQVHPVDLPDRLGGGFVFWTHGSGTTSLWRARTFTGRLVPLASLDVETSRVVPGFDRLYVTDARSSDVVALDPETGKLLDAGPLPKASGYGALAFADAWIGAVEVPLRGVLVSFDAGGSWRPLPGEAPQGLEVEEGRVVVLTSAGRRAIEPSGILRPHVREGGEDALFQGAGGLVVTEVAEDVPDEPKSAASPAERHPLRLAALHGWPDSKKTAIVAENGRLLRVSLEDGAVVASTDNAFSGARCHGVALERGFGFVCGDERAQTIVYRFVPPLGMEPVLSFAEPRFVAGSGNGALVVRGACRSSSAAAAGETVYCVRDTRGRLREVVVRGDRGVERVVALRDGRVAVLVPPRLGAPGRLNLIAADASVQSVALALPKLEAPLRALLEKGLWLDGVVQRESGELAGWVVGAGPFVGVRVRLDGRVQAGRVENDVDRVMLSGELALVVAASGRAGETLDGGFQWRELELPPPSEGLRTSRGQRSRERGCSLVGCAYESFVRIGWHGDTAGRELDFVEPPAATPRPSPGGGRWLISCAHTSEASPAALPRAETPRVLRTFGMRRRSLPAVDELESSAWVPFLERAAPARAKDELGFDAGTENDHVRLHGYAWGRRSASWERAARWQVHAVDRFAVDGLWSTAVSRSVWKDPVQAAQDFGHETSGQPVIWKAIMEPSGRAGVLRISTGSKSELYLLEEGKSIARVENLASYPLATLAGGVRLGSTWYVGSLAGSQLRILVIEGHRVTRSFDYPQRMAGRTASVSASIVRNVRGDALGIWARSAGWYVHPIDLGDGSLGEPLVIDAPAFAQMPAPCSIDVDGWLLEGSLGVEPYVEFGESAGAVRASRIEARLVASPFAMCTEALAGIVEGSVAAGLAASKKPWSDRASVPMTLTDRQPGGRRWAFRCAR